MALPKIQERTGRWTFRYDDENGVTRRLTFESRTKAEVERSRIMAARYERRTGLRQPGPEIKRPPAARRFAELASYWEQEVLPRQAPGTRLAVGNRIKHHLSPTLGACTLRQIDEGVVAVLTKELLAKPLSPMSVRHVLGTLGTMLRRAALPPLRWISSVPVIEMPKVPKRRVFNYLSSGEDVRTFLRAAYKQYGDHVGTFFAVAFLAGLRAGEIAGLDWSDIDFGGQNRQAVITVQRSFDQPYPKGQEAREVPVVSALLTPLKQFHLACGAPGTGLVFCRPEGGGMHPPTDQLFRYLFQKSLRLSGVTPRYPDRRLRFHDTRHTFATEFCRVGGDIRVLSKILGHSSVVITERTYAHFTRDHYSAAVYASFGAGEDFAATSGGPRP